MYNVDPGKSTITLRFCYGTFIEEYETTIEDLHTKDMNFNQKKYHIRITDCAGMMELSLFPRSCTFDIDGYMIVYAINDRTSFEMVPIVYEKIRDNIGLDSFPLVIVGNKSDLERVVSQEEGAQLARQYDAIFIESSAKDKVGIQTMFEKMLIEIEIKRGNMPRPDANRKKCSIM